MAAASEVSVLVTVSVVFHNPETTNFKSPYMLMRLRHTSMPGSTAGRGHADRCFVFSFSRALLSEALNGHGPRVWPFLAGDFAEACIFEDRAYFLFPRRPVAIVATFLHFILDIRLIIYLAVRCFSLGTNIFRSCMEEDLWL